MSSNKPGDSRPSVSCGVSPALDRAITQRATHLGLTRAGLVRQVLGEYFTTIGPVMKTEITAEVVRMRVVRLTVDFTLQELASLRSNLSIIMARSSYPAHPVLLMLSHAIEEAEQLALNSRYRPSEADHINGVESAQSVEHTSTADGLRTELTQD